MGFVLDFTDSALEDLDVLKKFEQTLILDQIEVQLSDVATTETRNRKPLDPNALAEWEL